MAIGSFLRKAAPEKLSGSNTRFQKQKIFLSQHRLHDSLLLFEGMRKRERTLLEYWDMIAQHRFIIVTILKRTWIA